MEYQLLLILDSLWLLQVQDSTKSYSKKRILFLSKVDDFAFVLDASD